MVTIFEGYEFTGKSYSMKKLAEKSGASIYEPSDSLQWVPYEHRYALGLPLLELAERGELTKDYYVSRGLISSIVYNRLYKQGVKVLESEEFLNYARKIYQNPKIITVRYYAHRSILDARLLYNEATNRPNNESYDRFESFREYYTEYVKFNRVYQEVLSDICGDNFECVSSVGEVK